MYTILNPWTREILKPTTYYYSKTTENIIKFVNNFDCLSESEFNKLTENAKKLYIEGETQVDIYYELLDI